MTDPVVQPVVEDDLERASSPEVGVAEQRVVELSVVEQTAAEQTAAAEQRAVEQTAVEGRSAERRARATLSALGEPGDLALVRFVERYGAVEALSRIAAGEYAGSRGGSYRERLGRTDPDALLAAAERSGARLVCPGDDEWPEAFGRLDEAEPWEGRGGAPLALWVRGTERLDVAVRRSCAVVGSRAASEYGRYVASELSAGLAERGLAVISGAAYGIDAAAHQGVLAVGGSTIAVLACGVDQAYPRMHAALIDRIAHEGLVVAEVPPGAHPTRPRFLVRNRIIGCLAQGTVVVEAALRSGALNTANWADRCHREVMGTPGPLTSTMSAGVHHLIREHRAVLVTNAAEVAEQLGTIGEDLAPPSQGERRSRDGLGQDAMAVLEAVPVIRPAGVASIALRAGLPDGDTLAGLGELLLLGYVERNGAGWRLSGRERAERRHPSTQAHGP